MQTCLSRPLSAIADPDRVRAVLAGSATGSSFLALLGDKRMLFSPSGRAFVMYGVIGRSWIAVGDPVGPQDEHEALSHSFVELCRRHRGWPAFYRVGEDWLAHYAGLGLVTLKLGEEARVALADGNAALNRPGRKNLRQSAGRAAREGCCFEVLEPGQLEFVMPELVAISGAWLRAKPTREKRFSVGVFDAAYLGNFPVAVVRHQGRPVAFASLWLAGDRSQLEVDLMRRDPSAPYGTMDFLFARLMGWGADRGYASLNLGLAPLSGLDGAGLAPAWRLLARVTVSQAGRFYNFDGLRAFKAKFAPEWRPKYLAAPGGLALPITILNAARLVAGGYRGLVGK